MKSAKNRIMT